jgi:hypothetical protein
MINSEPMESVNELHSNDKPASLSHSICGILGLGSSRQQDNMENELDEQKDNENSEQQTIEDNKSCNIGE